MRIAGANMLHRKVLALIATDSKLQDDLQRADPQFQPPIWKEDLL